MNLPVVVIEVPLILHQIGDDAQWWQIAGIDSEPLPCQGELTERQVREALAAHCEVDAAAGFSPEELEEIASTAPICGRLAVSADPPEREPGWEQPLALEIAVLTWERLGVCCAAVPAAGVLVHGASPEACAELVRRRLAALAERSDPGTRLRWWLSLAAWSLEPRTMPVEFRLRRPGSESGDSVLLAVATLAERGEPVPLVGVDETVLHIAEALAARPRRLVVVTGAPGSGKSACIASALTGSGVAERTAWAIDAVRLMVGHPRFPVWSDLLEAVCREAAEWDSILCLGGLFELCETGQAVGLPFTPADLLRPALARGDFSAVVEATPEELARIQAQRPGLLAHAEVVRLETPAWDRVAAIVRAHVPAQRLGDAELARLVELSRRYCPYSAVPGRTLRLARRLCAEDSGAGRLGVDVPAVEAAFAAETGLPLRLIAHDQVWPGEEVHAFLAQRVLGQETAVAAVTDAVVLAKARLDRPGRPLAVLLLAGPTGTGKTSLAMALAELLFGDRQRIQRFDLSEFASPASAARLVGGAGSDEGLLVAAIRRQPAGVLLLDEVEKADPTVHDYLLQLAGEGRLSDARGRQADAAGTVVLLTTNLGSASVGASALGFAVERSRDDGAYLAAVDGAFRPELVNRLDAVLVFAPLDRALVREVAAARLRRLEGRPGLVKPPHSFHATPEALAQFAAAATDPRWGARGVLRAIERQVVVPIARAQCGLPDAEGREPPAAAADRHRLRQVTIAAGAGAPLVTVTVLGAPPAAGQAPGVGAETLSVLDLARAKGLADPDRRTLAVAAATLHRQVRRIAASPLVFRLSAAAARERANARRLERRRSRPADLGWKTAFIAPGEQELRLAAFAALRREAEEQDLTAQVALLAALDEQGVPGPAGAAEVAALITTAGGIRSWLRSSVRETPPVGLRLTAFHRIALQQAAIALAERFAVIMPRARWTAWLPAAGGWTSQRLERVKTMPEATLALGIELAGDEAWPWGPALVGNWRLEVAVDGPVDGRRQSGILRIDSWAAGEKAEPPAAALRKGFVPKRADGERPWSPAGLDQTVEDWLDHLMRPLLDGEAGDG